jgi:hypothetical protein
VSYQWPLFCYHTSIADDSVDPPLAERLPPLKEIEEEGRPLVGVSCVYKLFCQALAGLPIGSLDGGGSKTPDPHTAIAYNSCLHCS